MNTRLTALEKLLEAASPGPWFLDGFDLHDTGTWLIAVMAREGNPSYKSDPNATKRLAAKAPALAASCIALWENYDRVARAHHVLAAHPGEFEDCDFPSCEAARAALDTLPEAENA